MIKKCFLFFSFILFSNCLFGQGWYKDFQGVNNSNERAISVVSHPAGGVLVLAQNDAIPNGLPPFLYRIDSNGNLLWSKLPLDSTEFCTGLTAWNNFFLLFSGKNITNGAHCNIISKLDLNGDAIWTKIDSIHGNLVQIMQSDFTSDGNLLILGNVFDGSNFHLRITKMDSLGTFLSDSVYTSMNCTSLGITKFHCEQSGGFYTIEWDYAGGRKVEFSPNGSIIDTLFFPSNQPLSLEDIYACSDGSNLAVYQSTSNQTVFIKTAPNGDTLWRLQTDTLLLWLDKNIIEESDGIVVGGCSMQSYPSEYSKILKIDTLGHITWAGELEINKQLSWNFDLCQDPNGGYYNSFSTFPVYYNLNSVSQFSIVKFDSIGRVYSNAIAGRKYIDNQANCVFNGNDVNSKFLIIEAAGPNGSIYAITDSTGNYSMKVGLGNYVVTQQINSTRIPVCPSQPNSYQINCVSIGGNFPAMDFANQFVPNQPDASINIINYNHFRPGGSSMFKIVCRNVGSEILSGTIFFSFNSNMNGSSFSILPNTINPGSFNWNYYNLAPDETIEITFDLSLSVVAIQGDTLSFIASTSSPFGDINSNDNSESIQEIVRSSFDPNEKQVSPVGWGTEGYISSNQELTYTVRFQNTGNDTAIDIVVADLIDETLDISSFQFISSSNNCSIEIGNSRMIRFKFKNILLPDSTTNELASHGFVCFKIRPVQGLPYQTQIFNAASIYFDYNIPVGTNLTMNTIADPNSILVNVPLASSISVFPNPATENVNFQFDGMSESRTILLFNQLGQVLLNSTTTESNIVLSVNELPSGLYFYRVNNSKFEIVGQGKLIVK